MGSWAKTSKSRACLAVLAAAGVAGLIADWTPRPAEKGDSPNIPTEVRLEADPHSNDPITIESNGMFAAYPAYELTSATMFGYVDAGIPNQTRDQDRMASSRSVANSSRQASTIQASHVPRDATRFFNDAQVASIKSRLKLTASQQAHWPALEAALRDIHWRRTADKAGHDTQAKSLDLDGEQIQRLKVAATPLALTLRIDQKDEVRTLLQLMGLDQLASQL
jgi:hypothetical protein